MLIDQGVRTFVDLTTSRDPLAPYQPFVDAAAEARDLDVRRVSHPIPDLGVIDDAGYDAIVKEIAAASERGVVYVHCWGGVGRTGTVVACLLGVPYYETIKRIGQLRDGTSKAHRECPETHEQHEYLRRRLGT